MGVFFFWNGRVTADFNERMNLYNEAYSLDFILWILSLVKLDYIFFLRSPTVESSRRRYRTMSIQRPIWWLLFFNTLLVAICFQSRYSWIRPVQNWRRDEPLRSAENNQDSPTNAIVSRRPIRRAPSPLSQHAVEERQKAARLRYEIAQKDPNLLSEMEFTDPVLGLSPDLVKTLTETMGLVRMTEIQARAFAPLVSGKSVLGRARTGTGKTLAFLIPIAQRLVETPSVSYRSNSSIGAIIVAPTRELAIQISVTAELLFPSVQCIHGGTNVQKDRALFNKRMPAVLVATPGRLVDHLEQKTRIHRRLFAHVLDEAEILVLDEADRLIQGFPLEVRKIMSSLPRKEKRQTILFSATIPKQLKALLLEDKSILPANHEYIDCIGANKDDLKEQTNLRVEQSYLLLKDMKSYIPSFVAIVQDALIEKDTKVIAFLPTTKMVDLLASILQRTDVNVCSIHSRMSRASRNRASTLFHQTKHGILLTSDVSARGVDYPDVNLVIQVRNRYGCFVDHSISDY
jgi:ATP-dependent RNA helicase MSS116